MANKKSTNMLLSVMGVLIVFMIVARVCIIQIRTVFGFLQLISLAFTAIYVFWLYKKPHGNMLKYAMLIFALINIVGGSLSLKMGLGYNLVRILASAAVCYCAGRLGRIDQNKYLLPVIGIAFLGTSVCSAIKTYADVPDNFFLILSSFNFTINYFIIMIAYFVRFEEHKLAGVMDAPKK